MHVGSNIMQDINNEISVSSEMESLFVNGMHHRDLNVIYLQEAVILVPLLLIPTHHNLIRPIYSGVIPEQTLSFRTNPRTSELLFCLGVTLEHPRNCIVRFSLCLITMHASGSTTELVQLCCMCHSVTYSIAYRVPSVTELFRARHTEPGTCIEELSVPRKGDHRLIRARHSKPELV